MNLENQITISKFMERTNVSSLLLSLFYYKLTESRNYVIHTVMSLAFNNTWTRVGSK